MLLALRHPNRIGRVIASAANLRPEALPANALENMRANVQEAEQMLKPATGLEIGTVVNVRSK